MYIRILILKSRALTTITQRIERDVKKIRDYATVFRDSGSEVKFPGLSRKIREGWQVWYTVLCLFFSESQPELNVLSKHEYDITVIISQNLSYFSLKFVESAFITRDQSSNVLDMYGVENRDKASRLLNYAYAKLGIIRSPEEREKWFWCFLLHFESKATYRELAATLRKEYRKGM